MNPASNTSTSTTQGTSDCLDTDQLEVDVATIKRLLLDAYNRYERAFASGDREQQLFFDGMIRGLHYVMEAHNE
jgi:hypothetical protein